MNCKRKNEELLNNYEEVFRKLKLTMKEKRSFQKELSKALHKNNELEIEIKRLVTLHENVEPCKDCENLTLKVVSLSEEVSELQQKSLNVTKLKKSGNDLNEMLNHQKVSQDKEGLGLANNEKTTSKSIAKPLNFEKVNGNKTLKYSKSDALVDASTRQKRARILRKRGVQTKSFIKPINTQVPLANTRHNQRPIVWSETTKPYYNPVSYNGLTYTHARVDQRPL